MDAAAIVGTLIDQGATQQLEALGNAIFSNATISDQLDRGMIAAVNDRIGQSIQPNGVIDQAITNAIQQQQGQAPPQQAPPQQQPQQQGQQVQCGSIPTTGTAYEVRPGRCFPDENQGCSGSILTNPQDPKQPITTADIFRRDSLFKNFADSNPRDLTTITDPNNAGAFLFEPDANDANVFNYRNFFFSDPRNENLVKYNKKGVNAKYSFPNIVRLRYDVGRATPLQSTNLSESPNDPYEREEIEKGRLLLSFMSRLVSWTLCPPFFTYRMVKLKEGYMSGYEYGKKGRGTRSIEKCIGVKKYGVNEGDGINDVYIYTFVDGRGNYINKDIPINKKTRSEINSFASGDLPYEDDFFRFPPNENNGPTIVCARYPDGILLFGYDGKLTPIPPFGTIVNQRKLHTENTQAVGYPDQEDHVLITSDLLQVMPRYQLPQATLGALNGIPVVLGGQGGQTLGNVLNIREKVIGAIGYITIMNTIKTIIRNANPAVVFGGGYKSMTRGSRRNRRYNNNKSIKRNKTKSKSKGRGRARAASMLKSAKQRFYRRGGGGMGMSLGLGSSGPQPLQYDSPLVSQASPV